MGQRTVFRNTVCLVCDDRALHQGVGLFYHGCFCRELPDGSIGAWSDLLVLLVKKVADKGVNHESVCQTVACRGHSAFGILEDLVSIFNQDIAFCISDFTCIVKCYETCSDVVFYIFGSARSLAIYGAFKSCKICYFRDRLCKDVSSGSRYNNAFHL